MRGLSRIRIIWLWLALGWLGVCFCSVPLHAEEPDVDDLYALADEAADEEVEKADDVLEKENLVHGEQWLTRGRLIGMVCAWVVLQLVAIVWFVRSAKKRGLSLRARVVWIACILLLGWWIALVYAVSVKKRLSVEESE